MKYTIQKLSDEDIPSCLEIYNYYISHSCYTLEEEELSLDAFKNRCHNIQSRFPYITIKNEDEKVLGYAYLDEFSSRTGYSISVDLSIYVSKDYLHEHLGYFLYDEIERLAKENAYQNIVSIITSDNQNSVRFHEKLGFIKQGELKDIAFKQNHYLDTYYYLKSLRNSK